MYIFFENKRNINSHNQKKCFDCNNNIFFTLYINLFYEDLKNINNDKKYDYQFI